MVLYGPDSPTMFLHGPTMVTHGPIVVLYGYT
jgi:hypothetical protein